MPAEEGQKLRHACSTCCRSFNNKRDLVKHQYMHREKPNLVCLHCNKTFTTESNYRRHINALQNVEKRGYNCGNCGILFRRLRDLEEHHELKHRDDKVFRCKVCQAEFSWQENLLKHQQVHEVNPHICAVCNHEFIDMTSLLVHRRTHHPPMAAATELSHKATRMMATQQPEASTEKPFTCHICGRRFKFDFSYQAHLDAHVIPASSEKSVDVGQGCESASYSSKPVYVQMDSEGIIDLPAFSSSSTDDVEIIVEVGNVATPAVAAGMPVSMHIPMIPDKNEREGNMCIKSETDKRRAADDAESSLRTSELFKAEQRKYGDLATGSTDNHEEKTILGSGSADENDPRYGALREADENEGPPKIDRMDVGDARKPCEAAVGSCYSYSTKPKKPTKRKRERVPFQFNCVMTDDKPFVCSTCGEAFRWEISLQVHTKVHTEGKVPGVRKIYKSGGATDKKKAMKCKGKLKNRENTTGDPGIKKSRIVYRRDSSDEEDVHEDNDEGSDPEEEQSSRVVHCHGKKIVERTLRPDNADDMLLEYLIGNETFISLEESNAHADEGTTEDCPQLDEGVLQNKLKEKRKIFKKKLPDDSWRKGKAILRKKRTWKPSKPKPEAQTMLSNSEGESVCQQAVESESPNGSLVERLGNCDVSCDFDARPLKQQGIRDADRDEEKKKPSCQEDLVELNCLDGFCAADSAAFVAGGGGAGDESDDRIVMTAAYAAGRLLEDSLQTKPDMLQNGIKTERLLLVNAETEQCDDAMCLPAVTDTFRGVKPTDAFSSNEKTASEQLLHLNACSSFVFSSSLHQDGRADDVLTGKKSPTFDEIIMSEAHAIQQNPISVSFQIPSCSYEIEPHTISTPIQGAEAEPQTTSAGLTSLQGAVVESHTTSAGLIALQGAEVEHLNPTADSIRSQATESELHGHISSAGIISSQVAEERPHMISVGLTPLQGADTVNVISSSQLGKESNATAYEFKCDDSCSVRNGINVENGEHAKDSMEGTCSSQTVVKNDSSVSRIALRSDQHCMTEEFLPALISSASAPPLLSKGENAMPPMQTTLDIIAGSIYSASSEPDQILVDNATLKGNYPMKRRNLRLLPSLFQSFKTQGFRHKGLTLNKSCFKKSVRGRVVIPSNVPNLAQGTITKNNNCSQCGKHFTSNKSLKRHQVRHRSSLRMVSFKCLYCLKRFSTMASLDQHLISLHVSSVASCESCKKQFATMDSFTFHQQHGCAFSAFERK